MTEGMISLQGGLGPPRLWSSSSSWRRSSRVRAIEVVIKRGRPLISHEVILELIGATRTRSGLRVHAELDRGSYPLGVKVTDRELAAVPLRLHDSHGEWNHTVLPAAA
jgi:Rhodopirellula transposase DDE domain